MQNIIHAATLAAYAGYFSVKEISWEVCYTIGENARAYFQCSCVACSFARSTYDCRVAGCNCDFNEMTITSSRCTRWSKLTLPCHGDHRCNKRSPKDNAFEFWRARRALSIFCSMSDDEISTFVKYENQPFSVWGPRHISQSHADTEMNNGVIGRNYNIGDETISYTFNNNDCLDMSCVKCCKCYICPRICNVSQHKHMKPTSSDYFRAIYEYWRYNGHVYTNNCRCADCVKSYMAIMLKSHHIPRDIIQNILDFMPE